MNPTALHRLPRYVIITPVRDEAQYIQGTINSVASQTVLPTEWVIVNDGSTDGTAAILEQCSAKYDWMKVVHRYDRGYRRNGSGVMEAVHRGLCSLETTDWEFLVKLDGDLRFSSDYFEKCLEQFRIEPGLGIGGGIVTDCQNQVSENERGPSFHVRGATKIYRRACWESIGGLLKVSGWDTVDELKANMAGWRTRTFHRLTVVQLRRTGDKEGGWRNAVKDGEADYISGYHPLFLLLKCLKRIFDRPRLVGACGIFCGFVSGYFKRSPRRVDPALIRYVRRQQLRRLMLLDSIWK